MLLMMKLLLVAGALGVLSAPDCAQCLKYEPQSVTLSGTLVPQSFPGPPNYESTDKGDRRERVWILRLRKPICVEVADHFDVHEEGQTQVQLVLEPEQYTQCRKLIGKKVTATGTLFHSFNGHHHKRLLLTTREIRRITLAETPREPQSGLMFIDRNEKTIAAPEERNILSPINGLEEQNQRRGL